MADSQVLKRLDFPAYCVRVLDNGLVAIAGGGGTSKTGVGNSIELGLVNYSTVDLANSENNRAQFQSIHTFEPHDAIMKFISFAVDRSNDLNNGLNSQKNNKNRGKNGSIKTTNAGAKILEENFQPEFDSNKSDLYIAACVNSSIEIYKVQPIIDKHSTNLTTKRNRTNSNSSQSSQTNVVRKRNSISRQNSAAKEVKELIQSKNMTASASLIHQKSIHVDQIIKEDDHDQILSEPESKTKVTKKLSASLNTSKYDDETINVLAICQVKVKAKNNQIINSRTLLCSGTSKGNVCIWELIIQKNNGHNRGNIHSDSNNNSNLSNSHDIPMKCHKLKIFKDAHGTSDIDDLQVNNEKSHLLSIGKDNRCIIWTLSPKIEKLMELNYVQMLKDKNLRMKHARFAQNGNCLYTTYIPRIRGGGRDMSTYIHRWNTMDSNYKVIKTHRVRNTIITSVQASKDGECLCCGDYEGQIYLFDANFNKLINFKKQHSSVVTDLAFYHDSTFSFNANKLILSLSIDRTLQCYTYLDTRSDKKTLLSLKSTSSALNSMTQFSQKVLNKLNLCSMNTFRMFLILCVVALLFCYFFTHLEYS